MSKTETPNQSKPSTLHLVYFVDSGTSKTLAIPLRHLRALVALGVGFGSLSFLSFALVALLLSHIVSSETNLRELKSALLAQTIVHDDLLREGPFLLATGSNVITGRVAEGVAKALYEGSSLELENDDFGYSEAEPFEETEGGGSLGESGAADAPTDELSGLRLETSSPAEETPSLPSGRESAAIGGGSPRDGGGRGQGTPSAAAEAPSEEPVSFSSLKASYDAGQKGVSFRFRISKVDGTLPQIDGRFCALLEGQDSEGKPVRLSYPKGFSVGQATSPACPKGLRIRINRFRDTTVQLPASQPVEITRAKIVFETADQVSERSYPVTSMQ